VSGDFLGDRKQALEEAFFHAEQEKQLAKLRDELERKNTREGLRSASGISDEAVLDRFIDLGLSGKTMAALSLVPLIWVAWADGKLDEREREAVLQAARGKGIEEGSATDKVLAGWLLRKPEKSLYVTWEAYIKALTGTLVPGQRQVVRTQIVGFARQVAEAAGGFLGIGKVSASEEEALAAIEAAFGD
jgi:hypothetical protein